MDSDKPNFESDLKQAQKDSVAKTFASHPTGDGLADIGIDALETVETLLKRFYEQEKPDQPLACAAGCTFCCHQYVGLSMPELAILTKFIQSNFDDAQVTNLISRLNDVVGKTKGMGRFERAASKIDCPLLAQESRKCSIYTARPPAHLPNTHSAVMISIRSTTRYPCMEVSVVRMISAAISSMTSVDSSSYCLLSMSSLIFLSLLPKMPKTIIFHLLSIFRERLTYQVQELAYCK